jgi:hypothetical protein
LSDGTRLRVLVFGIWYQLKVLYQSCLNFASSGGHRFSLYVYSKYFKKKYRIWKNARGKIFFMNHCVVNLYQDCSNNSPWVKIGPSHGIIDFHYVKKSSCLNLQRLELWYLVYDIIYRYSSKVVQNLPLVSRG